MNNSNAKLRPWESLTAHEQIELRIAFGYYLDHLSPTCSLDTKIQRFRGWLQEQGIDYKDPSEHVV